ncbi:MAG: hypothetical protein R3C15_02125 [Thermoleophilia bacterium]
MFRGADVRLLSRDPETGSVTLFVSLEPGWTGTHGEPDGVLELVVLEGALQVDAQAAPASRYVVVPGGLGGVELASPTGARLVAYWSPDLAAGALGPLAVVPFRERPWHRTLMPDGLHGVLHRSLRQPDVGEGDLHGGPAGLLRLALLTPGYFDERAHVHEVWEELVFLSGDLFMDGRGVTAPLTYLGNPAGFWHAPMATQQGSLILVHTRAPVGQVPRDTPGGVDQVEAYLDGASWLERPAHVPIERTPHLDLVAAASR